MNKDKQQFYKEFYSALEKAMEPSGGHLIEMDIPKNNHTMKGITVKFDNISAAPTIYPDFYYPDWKDGQSMSNIVSGIRSELLKTVNKISHFSMASMNPESAATHLYASIINYENNKEWLQTVPHERVADLAVFAKWRLGSVDNNSAVFTAVPASIGMIKLRWRQYILRRYAYGKIRLLGRFRHSRECFSGD